MRQYRDDFRYLGLRRKVREGAGHLRDLRLQARQRRLHLNHVGLDMLDRRLDLGDTCFQNLDLGHRTYPKRDTSVAFSVMNSRSAGVPSLVFWMPRLMASL